MMTIVTESDVIAPVLFRRRTSSLYQGLLALTAGVTVTPPVPLLASFTVRLSEVFRVRPPPVAVIVTIAGPRVAVAEAVRVIALLVPVVEGGLKLAVTPLGNPLALKATLPVNPPTRVIDSALMALAPRFRLMLEGFAVIDKSGDWLTVSINCVERVNPPPAPLTVTVTVPSVAELDAVRVSELLVPVADAGLNVAVTPPGNPLALKATLAENPPLRVIVIELVPFPPRLIVNVDGVAERVKLAASGVALTWLEFALSPLALTALTT
jgi:hypothetical protein